MKKGALRRQEILERLTDHVLAHGLQGASLRPLAAAAGTSDRMLLHYFADKDELLRETLTLVTKRLIDVLDAARGEPLPFDQLVPQLVLMLDHARIRPYMRLWLELVAFAVGEQEPFGAIARQIAQVLRTWIADALIVDQESEREQIAALTLTLVEGFVMLAMLEDRITPAAALQGIASLRR
jgi:AcrR family transcriptional regulator